MIRRVLNSNLMALRAWAFKGGEIDKQILDTESALAELEELQLFKSEHLRLEAELNAILHPNGDGPTAPSFCDLVSYVRKDITPKLCETCAHYGCGCSIQDRLLRIEPEATFDTFGCVHYEFNALLTEPSKHSTIQH